MEESGLLLPRLMAQPTEKGLSEDEQRHIWKHRTHHKRLPSHPLTLILPLGCSIVDAGTFSAFAR
ncbi:MAG: hypothetical protein HY667_00430 [Chloroflexi bacterium]|nr:hypothetical protein [Chloroflexota bacterium]